MRVGILGGTGKFGRALAVRLREAGDEVVIGSRDAERAHATAEELGVRGARNEDVKDVDLVVVAVGAGAALHTIRSLAPAAPLLSVGSEIEFSGGAAHPAAETLSLAERIAENVNVPVAAGLHTLAAGKLARGRLDEDALVCGDDPDTKDLALELGAKLVTGRALDAGPLASARALESLASLLVNVNRRYKAHAGIRLTGVD